MIRSLKIALAALALGTVVAANAAAQDSTGVRAGVTEKATFASLIAAVNATPTTTETLKARTDISAGDVVLVNAQEVAMGQDEATLKAALAQHASHTEELRTTLGTHAAVKDALDKQGNLTLADVIAVDAQPTGKVLVFYRKAE